MSPSKMTMRDSEEEYPDAFGYSVAPRVFVG
ncbi:predicted protein [Sclerotinia sclerotiorum 1980 UF-70]|uniref:Uncharacterized protein n=1 Tax=Sclerotinia sclerotiorum (strain ATCC 18683 / 1980 / Ss-1) TaxID=665079 RepID=A7EEW3_SCLS1|nr:predicted protein [Sclerotinia sclerotiorum 1980 UF-70]EDO01379.1 predicted protein [Sclerotinia sclerotiorum 1980 UF-70]